MMKLVLDRQDYTNESTIGKLFVDGVFECYVLEDVVRQGAKVFGETAIPQGTYEVIITQSPRFKRLLPLLVKVPGYEGVRIHPGNTAKDTEGCLLVGTGHQANMVTDSKTAFNKLFAKLEKADKIELAIID